MNTKNLILCLVEDLISQTKVSPILEFSNPLTAGIAFKRFIEEQEKEGISRECFRLRSVAEYDLVLNQLIEKDYIMYTGKDIDEQIEETKNRYLHDDNF